MERPNRVGAVLGWVLFGAALSPVAAQERESQVPVFRTGVDAVLVDVLVHDEDGNPVGELTRDDFQILEDGVEQEIATFDVTDWTSYVARETGETAPPAEGVNTYPRRFVFILNRQGARFDDIARAKRGLANFVVESLAEGDEAMVIDVGYSTKVVKELGAIKEETLESIRNLSQMQLEFLMGADRAAGQLYRDLESIAEALGELPGRKIVVLLSNELQTFVRPGSRAADQGFALDRTVEALNQANATVYTIDIRGPESRMSAGGGLSPLATETGGRFFRNNTSFEAPLRRIGRENQRYYLLSYVPSNAEADGKYRKIEVRVNRPDVQVVAREGYFARKAGAETTETPEDDGNRAPAPAAAELPIAVEITTYLLPTGNGSVRVPVSVALPEELLTGEGGSERRLSVSVEDDRGDTVRSFDEPVSLERYFVMENLELEPGSYLLKVAVRSEERELYRAETGVRIPSGFGDRFGLSSIIPVVGPERAASVGDDLPILPTASVERGESLHVLFQVFAGDESPAERARVSYRILDEDGALARSGSVEEELRLTARPEGTPVIISLPTGELSYGRYRVEVRVEDPSSGAGASTDIEFRVR